jgi:hypothetical protein
MEELDRQVTRWVELTGELVARAADDPQVLGSAAFDYLLYSGYTLLAYIWAMSAATAAGKLKEAGTEKMFYEAKLATARFYFRRLLPRNDALVSNLRDGTNTLMDLDEAFFAF